MAGRAPTDSSQTGPVGHAGRLVATRRSGKHFESDVLRRENRSDPNRGESTLARGTQGRRLGTTCENQHSPSQAQLREDLNQDAQRQWSSLHESLQTDLGVAGKNKEQLPQL